MTHHRPNSRVSSAADQAASWVLRLQDKACSRQDREQFQAWLGEDASHAREYEDLLEIWGLSGDLEPTPSLARTAPISAARRHPQPRYLAIAAGLLLFVLGGLVAWLQGWAPNTYKGYRAEAEIRDVTLPDGSSVSLNTDTRLSFLNFRDRREVRFEHGEAFFKVQHDVRHPFQILAGNGRITVTGTQFNVWHSDDQVIVTLKEGSVKVQGDVDHPDHDVVHLAAGQQARYSDTAPYPQLAMANLDNELAWRRGKLILSDMTLAEALPLINRYLKQPVRIGDDEAGRIRIGGIFNTADIDGLVRSLPRIAPVRIVQDTVGTRTIQSVQIPSA